jgi:hypothetical protein
MSKLAHPFSKLEEEKLRKDIDRLSGIPTLFKPQCG